MRNRVSRVGVVGLLVAALAALAAGGTTANGQSDEELILGMPIALTGAINFFDGPFLNGAQLAVADINKRGGVLGMKLRIVTSDTKSQIPQGTVAANDVISKGAKFIFPTVDFDYGGAATRVASSKNLISMTQVGDPRYGLKGLGPLAFNIYQATPTEGAATAQFIKQKGWKRPYLLTDTALNYTKTLCQFVKSSWKGSIAGESTFNNSDPSIASQISRMRSAKPDVIVLCSYPPGGATAVRQIRAAGMNIPIVGGVTMEGTYWLGNKTKENNFYATAGGVVRGDPNPVRAKIFAQYKARYGSLPPFSLAVLSGYSVVQAIAQAVTKAKSTDTEKVKAELEKFRNVQFASGPTTWTPTCHVPLGRPYVIVKFSKGNPVPHYAATVKPASVSRDIC